MKIAAAQLNPMACDIAGNLSGIIDAWKRAEAGGAELVVTPEHSISGYPLEDTAKNPDVLASCRRGLNHLVELSRTMQSGIIVGMPERGEDGHIYNSAYLVHDGIAEGPVRKRHLPNYDVFDEKRIYTEGAPSAPITFRGVRLGIMICEDVWYPDVAADLKAQGADVLIVPNASPFYAGKHQKRISDVLIPRAQETGLPLLYVNQVGGQDEIVFDGRTTVMNGDGTIAAMMKGMTEDIGFFDLEVPLAGPAAFRAGKIEPLEDIDEETYRMTVVCVRDYLNKMDFKGVLLGMSGGLDSALVAAILCDAIGPQNVHLYKLPSHFSSADSRTDADDAAHLLGAPIAEIEIAPIYDAFMSALTPHFAHAAFDATEENLQARIRGTLLMSLSNKNGWLLISTGNKSEISVGYCTLYGDMNGGYNALKDILKFNDGHGAFGLSAWRNTHHHPDFLGPPGTVVPENILRKAPSAELRPGQVDQDTLPPYPVLDIILKRYVEQDQSLDTIEAETGFDRGMIEDVVRKVDRNEFKRRQSCPGPKTTECNFGKGRRVPIVRPSIPAMQEELIRMIGP